jgi:thiamine kinase-like enzyme
MLGLNRDGSPRAFVVVEPASRHSLINLISSTSSFHVTACLDTFVHEGWSVRQYEPLPPLHQPARWNAQRIRQVAEDASLALEGVLPRTDGIPAHWRPMHGDYVPWNLREDTRGRLWLLDWEDAAWAPPLSDLVRFAVAYHSLGWSSTSRIAEVVRATVGIESTDALIETATFWLAHPNLQPGDNTSTLTRQKAKDSARAAREVAAFRVLASRG